MVSLVHQLIPLVNHMLLLRALSLARGLWCISYEQCVVAVVPFPCWLLCQRARAVQVAKSASTTSMVQSVAGATKMILILLLAKISSALQN